jgi:hypothetical protein
VRHATAESLRRLEPVLADLRGVPGLKERRPGVFYRHSRAFLHFHEDGDRLFVDVRLDDQADFERSEVTTPRQRVALLRDVRAACR